jgi:hypothetical protein
MPILYGIYSKINKAWKTVSLVHRIDQGNQNDLLNIQLTYLAVSSLAIFCAVASYLWTTEVNEVCNAPYYAVGPSDLVSVHNRFRDILKIWWTFTVVDFFRTLIGFTAVSTKSTFIGWIYQILFINDALGLAAVIIVHAYRF